MELILLALLLQFLQKNTSEARRLDDRKALAAYLESGDWGALLRSERFQASEAGALGKHLADLFAALQNPQALLARLGKETGSAPLSALFSGEAVDFAALAQLFQKPAAAAPETANPFAPVARIADPEILYRLNRYFAE